MMIKYYIILIIMTVIGSFASLFLKKASGNLSIRSVLKNKNIYIGGLLYLLSAILNIYILKYLAYSIVLPLTSITYVWTLLISKKMLNESITYKKVLGITFIIFGAIVIVLQ